MTTTGEVLKELEKITVAFKDKLIEKCPQLKKACTDFCDLIKIELTAKFDDVQTVVIQGDWLGSFSGDGVPGARGHDWVEIYCGADVIEFDPTYVQFLPVGVPWSFDDCRTSIDLHPKRVYRIKLQVLNVIHLAAEPRSVEPSLVTEELSEKAAFFLTTACKHGNFDLQVPPDLVGAKSKAAQSAADLSARVKAFVADERRQTSRVRLACELLCESEVSQT